MPRARRSSVLRRHLVVLGLFITLSIVLTHPLAWNLGSRILGAPAPGDNFEYLYKTWWFKHALFDLHVSPFFNATMFHPFGYDVALSETTLSNTIPALPLALALGEVPAYNLTMLFSFVLSGFATYLLVLYLTKSRAAGVLAGVVFAFCPYRMAHLGVGHLPLMGTQWLPLLLLYLDKMIHEPRVRNVLLAALFYALGALSAWYYAYIFALAGLVYVLLRGRPWRRRLWRPAFLRAALVFALGCLVLVGPFVLPVTRLWKEGDRPQSLRYVDQFSASPLDFVYPNVMQPLWGSELLKHYAQNVNENALYLGILPLALALVAVRRRRERPVNAFAWLSLIFAVLALGTTLHWGSAPVYLAVPTWLEHVFTTGMGVLTKRLALFPISSYSLRVERAIYLPLPMLLLYLYLPFFNAMRVWARLGLVTILGVAVLAGYGWQELRQGRPWQRLARSPARGLALSTVLLGLALLDVAAFPYALGSTSVQARPVDRWLASQPDDGAVMEFPVNKALSGYALYMSRTHGKRISFGYGTFFPREFNEKRGVLEAFPSSACVALLKVWGVRYVLVGSRSYGSAWSQMEQALSSADSGLRLAVQMDDLPVYAGDRVLRLLPGTERAFVVDRVYVYEVL